MTISVAQAREVRLRAGGCCEYCLLAAGVLYATFHIDHIVPTKHGGSDFSDNLCLACPDCNRYKGYNVAALDPLTDEPARLYNPRAQVWDDHFELKVDMTIAGRSPEGRATVAVLRMNLARRVSERYEAWLQGDYPCQAT